ncbi:MAG: carbamate kinase [Dehalococcoidia bacterium]|nr:carbamate kinase [Dehalococcoidia bacterium]
MVVALGGNAILPADHQAPLAEQYGALERACERLLPIIGQGHQVVITHGNGPQVGNLLIQQEEAARLVPPLPLDLCIAMTQVQMGTMVQQVLTNQLRRFGIQREVVTLVSHFLVARDDPDFRTPSKPVGPFLTEEEKRLAETRGHTVHRIGHGPRPYRRVVASPAPLRFLERHVLKTLFDSPAIVIAAGGDGVPVVLDENGAYHGVEAVIDKDRSAERLAEVVLADTMLILTNVTHAYLRYGTPQQTALSSVTLEEARRYLTEGHFARGSMAPKVEACVRFLEYGGDVAIIAALDDAAEALQGSAGTRFTRS